MITHTTRLSGSAATTLIALALVCQFLITPQAHGWDEERVAKLMLEPTQPTSGTTTVSHSDDPAEAHVELLRDFRIKPSVEGIRQYLRDMTPTPEWEKHVKRLIEDLGSNFYSTREAATEALIHMPLFPQKQVEAATQSSDPEVVQRARQILEEAGKTGRTALLASCLRVMQYRHSKGSVEVIFEIVPRLEDRHDIQIAHEAIEAASDEADLPVLKKHLAAKDATMRALALRGIIACLKDKAIDHVRQGLKDESEHVRIIAARALAERGERDSLEPLGQLLEADDLQTRLTAVNTLRSLTHQNFSYVAYGDDEERGKAVRQWRDWIKDNGKSAKLHFPLKSIKSYVGRILVCFYSNNEVQEFDAKGKHLWTQGGLQYPWSCDGTSDGHRIVVSYSGKFIVEYDAKGKEVWRHNNLPQGPMGVERLTNGNTLVACGDGGVVLEIDRKGKTVWEHKIDGRPTDAKRTPDGNTVITLQNAGRVVVVDRKGKTVFEKTGLKSPLTGRPLENGNILIAEMSASRVVEIDRKGKIVWSHAGVNNPYDAQRMPDGRTLVTSINSAMIIGRKGKVDWQQNFGKSVARAAFY